MSICDRLTPESPQVAVSSRQTKERQPVHLSPLLSLSSPVIKKKAIQIPSFDEKGLIHEKHNTKQTTADRCFIPICSSKASTQSSWSKSCRHSQMNHGASTLPRTKPKAHSSSTLSAKPSISIFPAPEPNSSPTPPPLTLKPSDSTSASQLSELSPLQHQHQHQPKPSVSPTLIVPTPRLSPSPTSLCQGMSSDSQGGKQPSPVAKERRARSITISNTKSLPHDPRHDSLDQKGLLDFTHTAPRTCCPTMKKDPAASENPCLLHNKSKKERVSKDKQQLLPRNLEFTAIPKPKANIKQHLECGLTGKQKTCSESEGIMSADVVHRESQSVFDGLATQSSLKLHRKWMDYPPNRHYTQTEGLASSHQSNEHMNFERSGALPLTPKISFSTQPLLSQSTVSPNIQTRRKLFDLLSEKKADTTVLPGSSLRRPEEEQNTLQIDRGHCKRSASQNNQSLQKHRLWLKSNCQTAQMGVQSTVCQSERDSEDYSKSRHIDQKVETSQCTHRLNRLKTCLVPPQTQEASRAASAECTSQTGSSPKPDIQSQKHMSDHEIHMGQNKSRREVKLSDTGLNQLDVLTPPDHHVVTTKPLGYHPEKNWPVSLAHSPFSTNSSGITTKGVLPSQPQHRVCQRPEETMTTVSLQPHESPADSAFITEEPEAPYYVTMYYPGSVYVGEYWDTQSSWRTSTH